MFGQQCRQPDRFETKILSHQVFTAGRFVTLVKQEVQRLENAVQAAGQLRTRWNLKRNLQLADPLSGSSQSLGDRRFCSKKSDRDLSSAESAKSLYSQRGLRLRRDLPIATANHAPQPPSF